MTDDLASLITQRKPTPERPLFGLTVLVVEDSRFACEAVRLLCLRSGARIRRADSLAAAHRHLSLYRPSVILVDMGLPDGSGADLIQEFAAEEDPPIILATSGDPNNEVEAMQAGADGFLPKPITSLGAFQQAILDHVPQDRHPTGPRTLSEDVVTPDKIALRDDLAHVAEVLGALPDVDGNSLDYIAQFLASLARSAEDRGLAKMADTLTYHGGDADVPRALIAEVAREVETRLTGTGPI